MQVSDPITLAKLPRNPHGRQNISFGTVWGWREGIKRRRYEACAAVDGSTLNIYEAKNGEVVFSHAVPPTTRFAGPPCSLRWKEDGVVHRQTCYATQDDRNILHVVTNKGKEPAKTASVELTTSNSPILHLDIHKYATSNTILVLQQDATVTLCSGDLKYVSTSKLVSDISEPMEIMTACSVDVRHARKSILRARSDLYNLLDDDTQILVTVSDAPDATTLTKNVAYCAWAVSPQRLGGPTARLELTTLFEHNLSRIAPALDARDSSIVSAKFNSRETALDIRLLNGLLRFDLQTAWPRPFPTVRQVLDESTDTIPLSQSHLLAVYPHSLRLIDVNYSTLQSSVQNRLKRTKTGSISETKIELVSYLAGTGRVLARDQQRLIAIDVGFDSADMQKSLPASTLAQNIGLGVSSNGITEPALDGLENTIGAALQSQPLPAGWKKDLQKELASNNISAFEDVIIKSYNLEASAASRASAKLPRELLDFVLESMFEYQAPSPGENDHASLSLRFTAVRLVRALNSIGLLRVSILRHVFRLKNHSSVDDLPYDAVARAMVASDPSFGLLQTYAQSLTTPEPKEATLVLKFLLEQVLSVSPAFNNTALPTSGSDGEMDVEQRGPVDIDDATASLPETLEASIVSAIEHLGVFRQSLVSSNLKAIFKQDDIFRLVQFLRQQLFKAGHTGSIVSAPEATALPTYVSLQSAAKLLSGCMDAFGPLDLISGNIDDDSIENIIPDLLSEISLATQYLEESTDLQGILRETLRYAESQQTAFSSKRKAITNGENGAQRQGEIMTLYAQRTEDEGIDGLPSALPLSLRDEDAITATRVRKGGGQVRERSQREILMLQNRQKGPYTFERLVL